MPGDILQGRFVRLEPLDYIHTEGLVSAAASDGLLYRWSPVPQGLQEAKRYIQNALALQEAGSAQSFATIRQHDGVIIGSTRFFNLEYWDWAKDSPRHDREFPDACEIGYTWLSRDAIRTTANTEAKLLMLEKAFERGQVVYPEQNWKNKQRCTEVVPSRLLRYQQREGWLCWTNHCLYRRKNRIEPELG